MSTGPQFHNGNGNLWNPEFDWMLKAGAVAPSKLQRAIQQIQRRNPDLDRKQILKRTAELDLIVWHRPWTEEEKTYVQDNVRESPVVDLANRLRRTPGAIYKMLWKSKIVAKYEDGYTQTGLARDLHVSPRKVRRWVRLGWLTPYQGRIKDPSLERFLKEHGDEIDPRKLDAEMKEWLQELGLREGANHRQAAWLGQRKQSFRMHVCTRCGRKIYGNSFRRHAKACATELGNGNSVE